MNVQETFRNAKISYNFNPGAVIRGQFHPCHFEARVNGEGDAKIKAASFEAAQAAAHARVEREKQ